VRLFFVLFYRLVVGWLPAQLPGARQARAWTAGRICTSVDPTANILPGVTLSRDLVIKEKAGVGAGSTFIGGARIELGRNLRMGPECMFLTGDHRIPGEGETFDHSGSFSLPILVEDDVFIGARATILRGVTIGRGATVGAGAVVTRDVPPGAVVAGNPARVVRAVADTTPGQAPNGAGTAEPGRELADDVDAAEVDR